MKRQTSLTDEQRDLVVQLYKDGKTASAIAAELWSRFAIQKTRNAICGVLNRAGVRPGRPRDKARIVEPAIRVESAPVSPARRSPQPPPMALADASPPKAPHARPTGMLALRRNQCRSVIGRGEDGLALYCGATVAPTKSWCTTCYTRFVRRSGAA